MWRGLSDTGTHDRHRLKVNLSSFANLLHIFSCKETYIVKQSDQQLGASTNQLPSSLILAQDTLGKEILNLCFQVK